MGLTRRMPPFSRSASTALAAATMPAWPNALPSSSSFSCGHHVYQTCAFTKMHMAPVGRHAALQAEPMASPYAPQHVTHRCTHHACQCSFQSLKNPVRLRGAVDGP